MRHTARLGASPLYIPPCPKGLRILRAARETGDKPRQVHAGVTPARIERGLSLVSLRDSQNPQPFLALPRCTAAWPCLARDPPWRFAKSSALSGPAPGRARLLYMGGGPERAEDFACRARNEEQTALDPCRCHTCVNVARFVPRFSRDSQNPQPFLALPLCGFKARRVAERRQKLTWLRAT